MKVTLSLLLCFLVLPLPIAGYHYDTNRGPRDYKPPNYTAGPGLFKTRKSSNPNDFIFGIDTTNKFSRPLLLTKLNTVPDDIKTVYGDRGLTCRYSVDPFGSLLPPTELIRGHS